MKGNRRGMEVVPKAIWLTTYIAALAAVAFYPVGSARATPGSGFSGTTLAKGTFAPFQVVNHLTGDELHQLVPGFPGDSWFSLEKTDGPSDLYVQTNTWQPGATTGWHGHPGHSLIIITSGQVTEYHADCTAHVYGPGTANGTTLIDTGDDVHVIRNEGVTAATGFAVQLVASGAPRRIDASAPASCRVR
jgi:quercetin dioxygenase-like cupin family protein